MLVLDEGLFGRVLLAALLRDFFVLLGHLTLLQLAQLRLILVARGCLILTLGIQLALKDLCMG